MSTHAVPAVGQFGEHADAAGHARINYLNCSHGFKSWAFTLDHKRIGVMYLIERPGAFLLGGIFALLVRTELLTPGPHDHGRGDLQPDVHPARRDHGRSCSSSRASRRRWATSSCRDARGQGRGASRG